MARKGYPAEFRRRALGLVTSEERARLRELERENKVLRSQVGWSGVAARRSLIRV